MCHALKLLAGILPEESRPDPLPAGVAKTYERLTGCRQRWEMFRTTPTHFDYRVGIVITDAEGRERTVGPLLPGFQPWPVPENARFYNLFQSMLNGTLDGTKRDAYVGLRIAYLRRVDDALKAQRLIAESENWSLELDEDYIRHVWHIRQDGVISLRSSTRFSLESPDGISVQPAIQ